MSDDFLDETHIKPRAYNMLTHVDTSTKHTRINSAMLTNSRRTTGGFRNFKAGMNNTASGA